MGFCLVGALICSALSLYWQSFRYRRRSYVEPYRLEARLRACTGYTLACLLLLIGFFAAGAPIGNATSTVAMPSDPVSVDESQLTEEQAALPTNNETGAFGGPPPTRGSTAGGDAAPTLSPTPGADGLPTQPAATPAIQSPTPNITATSALSPTATPTPPPTSTPSPTLTPTPPPTPTPITEPTARINTGGGTLWLRRTPGGNNIALIQHNDIIILMPGHASQEGLLWQEIKTVNGLIGWVQSVYLVDSDEEG